MLYETKLYDCATYKVHLAPILWELELRASYFGYGINKVYLPKFQTFKRPINKAGDALQLPDSHQCL